MRLTIILALAFALCVATILARPHESGEDSVEVEFGHDAIESSSESESGENGTEPPSESDVPHQLDWKGPRIDRSASAESGNESSADSQELDRGSESVEFSAGRNSH